MFGPPAASGPQVAWTPRLAIGGSSTGITYVAQNGVYVRHGALVTILLRIILSSKGVGTGVVTIEDLPFTVGARGCAPIMLEAFGTTYLPVCRPNFTTTTINIYAGNGSALAATDITGSTSFYVTATYPI